MFENFGAGKKWLLIAILLVASVALIFSPAKRFYRTHKETHNLTLAKHFFEKAEYANAALSARQVLVLNPTNVTACRMMADIADIMKSPVALDFRRQLAEYDPSSSNKLAFAEAGLRYQNRPYPVTTQVLSELAATSATNLPLFHVISAEYALALQQLDRAENELRTAAALEPTNRLYQLNLAVVSLHATNREVLEKSRANLRQFATETNFAGPALRALLADRLTHDDLSRARDFSQQLLETSQATLADRLQNLSILKKSVADLFPPQLARVQQSVATNAIGAAQVGLWMLGNGMASDAIKWLASLPKGVRGHPAIQVVQASAFDATEDWQALREHCAHGTWKDLDFMRLAYSSHAWAKLGELSVSHGNWHAAVDAAGGRFSALTGLLDLTARWQLPVERQELFWNLLQKFPRQRWIAAALEEQCYRAGDTAGLRRIYRQMATAFPESPEYQNNLAYTSLLLRTNQTEATTEAAELYKKWPENSAIASTYAFAMYLHGNNTEGLAVLQKMGSNILAQPSLALHYGILLAATGDRSGAEHYLTVARADTGLLPEEIQLIKKQ